MIFGVQTPRASLPKLRYEGGGGTWESVVVILCDEVEERRRGASGSRGLRTGEQTWSLTFKRTLKSRASRGKSFVECGWEERGRKSLAPSPRTRRGLSAAHKSRAKQTTQRFFRSSHHSPPLLFDFLNMATASPAQTPWRVYGFPEIDMLVFSTHPVLYTRDNQQLNLEAGKTSPGSWTDEMLDAYEEVSQ